MPVYLKIFSIGVILALLFGGVMFFQTRTSMSAALYQNLELRVFSETRSHALSLEQPVITDDVVAIQRILTDTLEGHPEIKYMIVRDVQGRIIAHTFNKAVPEDLIAPPAPNTGSGDTMRVLEDVESKIFEVTNPILSGRGGVLQLGMSDESVRSELADLTGSMFQIFIASVVIAFALSHVLAQFLTYPIAHLKKASEKIAEGDFTSRSGVFSGDEVGRLSESFNKMAESLQIYSLEVKENETEMHGLIQKIVNAQEEERKVLSRELHDHLGQSLLALLLSVRANCELNGVDGSVSNDVEDKIQGLIDEVHHLAWGMHPSILDDYGLEHALTRYIDETAKRTGIRLDFQYGKNQNGYRLPRSVEVTLYRIAQEALSNVVRHAEAERASVVVLQGSNEVILLIEDSGKGFNVNELPRDTSMGLIAMRERAALLGGSFRIESRVGQGTTMRVRIPVDGETQWE